MIKMFATQPEPIAPSKNIPNIPAEPAATDLEDPAMCSLAAKREAIAPKPTNAITPV